MIIEKDFAFRQMCGGRERQEDAFSYSLIGEHGDGSDGILAVVADGMGGHKSGETASKVAVEAFLCRFAVEPGSLHKRLVASMIASNKALAAEFKRKPELEGMGTTLLAVAVTRTGIQWVSVGDSLLYLLRDGELKRLNADHSFRPLLEALIAAGELTPEMAARHPFRNLLRSALLGDEIEMIDAPEFPMTLQKGDLIIAASDGLLSLSDSGIVKILSGDLSRKKASGLAELLLKAVEDRRVTRQDNATVAVIRAMQDKKSPVRKKKHIVKSV